MPKAQPWDEYVQQVSEIHKNKYTYPSSTSVHEKIEIICPIHGSFWQKKYVHKKGAGCPSCNPTPFKSSENLTWEKAKAKHPEYDFSDSVYLGSHQPVTVRCKKHGLFESTPNTLRASTGCPQCGTERRLAGQKRRREKDKQKPI